ncbi:MAG: glycosyltransferase family 39 protein [Candidatus Omnitrophica bacterium]|nr:glycosyltransferase family 39 protein [Candidatus Omnitrophota bacterium]
MKRSITILLLFIFMCALAVRVGVAFYLTPKINFADAYYYDRAAENICVGKGAVIRETWVANRMPLYPYMLAFFKTYASSSEIYVVSVRIFQSFLNALLVIPVFFMVTAILSPGYGLLAAALIAFDPIHILSSSLLLTEVVYSFCLTFFIWGTISFSKRGTLFYFLISGISVVAGMYIRESMFHIIAILALSGIFVRRCRAIRAYMLTLFIISICALCPWIIRNHVLLHEFVPFTTNSGFTLYDAVNPHADGGTDVSKFGNEAPEGLSEVELDRFWKRKASEAIRHDPVRVMLLTIRKFGKFWNIIPNAQEFRRPLLIAGFSVFYIPLFICFIIGLIVLARNGTCEVFMIYVPVIYAVLLHLVINGSLRYRMPLEPFVIVFAVAGLRGIVDKMRCNISQSPL